VLRIVEMKLAFEYPFTETNKAQNIETLADLRNFFRPYLQKGEKDGCYYLGSNPAWNTACWPAGNPILHCAAQYGCTALVYLILTEYLPENSGLINFQRKNGRGRTPLHLAVYFEHKQVESLLLAFKANESIRSVEKGKWESVLDLRRERGTDRLPELPQSTAESRNAAREIQNGKPDEFESKRDTYPKAKGPVSGNRRRTNAPEVQKKAEDTDNTDSDGGEWEQAGSKTKSKPTKNPKRYDPLRPRASTSRSSSSTTKANLSELLEELVNVE
jgi:hypothetical protein